MKPSVEVATAPCAVTGYSALHTTFTAPKYTATIGDALTPFKLVSEFTLQPLIPIWFNFHTCTEKIVRNTSFHRFNRFVSDFIVTSAGFFV
jgi:hypothetical protein